jgi:hypothetical protein
VPDLFRSGRIALANCSAPWPTSLHHQRHLSIPIFSLIPKNKDFENTKVDSLAHHWLFHRTLTATGTPVIKPNLFTKPIE